jgi:hypothetical protein
LADVKELLIVFFAGLVIGYFLRGHSSAQAYSNEERWSIIKDERGRVQEVIVHREAKTNE